MTCKFISRSYSSPHPQRQVVQRASIFNLHLNSLYKAQLWLCFIHFPFDHHTVPSLPIFSILPSLCLSILPPFFFPPCTEPIFFSCMPPPPISIVSISSCSSVLLDLLWFFPLSLSPSLTLSLFHSLCFHLGDSSVHAASNLSHCLSGCSVYALCDSLFLSSFLSAVLHCIPRLSSAHISISPHSRSLFLFLYLRLSHPMRSYPCCALLRSAPLFGKILYSLIFFRARAECTSATGGRGIWHSWCSRFDLPWIFFGSVWAGEEERAGKDEKRGRKLLRWELHVLVEVKASWWWWWWSRWLGLVADGCPSRVMPWDLRAFRQLELETLSHFCPPSGATLILVPGETAGHQWVNREEWTPWTSWMHHGHWTGPSENCAMQPSYHLYAC